MGIPFDLPGLLVSRLEEAVQVVKGLWGEGAFRFSGRHYTISGLDGMPKPVQRPYPPIFIAGGGKRLLSLAGREADIVGIMMQAKAASGITVVGAAEAMFPQRVGWVKEAAGTDSTDLNWQP